jgi:hypothetical protein
MSYLTPAALPKSVRPACYFTVGLAAYLGAFRILVHRQRRACWRADRWCAGRLADCSARGPHGRTTLAARTQTGTSSAQSPGILIVAGAGGTVAALAHARPTAVSSAEVSVPSATTEPRTRPRSIVITNNSDRPLEAYRVSVRRDGQVLWSQWP